MATTPRVGYKKEGHDGDASDEQCCRSDEMVRRGSVGQIRASKPPSGIDERDCGACADEQEREQPAGWDQRRSRQRAITSAVAQAERPIKPTPIARRGIPSSPASGPNF